MEYSFRGVEGRKSDPGSVSYIAIEGVIGAGKTTLACKLAERLKANMICEKFEENPFLGKFYGDRKRYAFQTQLFFLVNRYKQLENLFQENLFSEFLVSDYIFEKDRIFALINLDGEELKLYDSMFPLLQKNLRKPDLVVYLKPSIDRLLFNIKKRGREMEKDIDPEYITQLVHAYDDYFFKYSTTPLLTVQTSDIDFVGNNDDFEELFGLVFDTYNKV
ncbi:MAG: deoxynucleoside kinase [Bacteroidota bacterium]